MNKLIHCYKCQTKTSSTLDGSKVTCNECQSERQDYPYWLDEFRESFGNNEVYYNEGSKPSLRHSDIADGYRVFMILCNNNFEKSRMEVLEILKNSRFESNPIQIQNEWFWTVPIE